MMRLKRRKRMKWKKYRNFNENRIECSRRRWWQYATNMCTIFKCDTTAFIILGCACAVSPSCCVPQTRITTSRILKPLKNWQFVIEYYLRRKKNQQKKRNMNREYDVEKAKAWSSDNQKLAYVKNIGRANAKGKRWRGAVREREGE